MHATVISKHITLRSSWVIFMNLKTFVNLFFTWSALCSPIKSEKFQCEPINSITYNRAMMIIWCTISFMIKSFKKPLHRWIPWMARILLMSRASLFIFHRKLTPTWYGDSSCSIFIMGYFTSICLIISLIYLVDNSNCEGFCRFPVNVSSFSRVFYARSSPIIYKIKSKIATRFS